MVLGSGLGFRLVLVLGSGLGSGSGFGLGLGLGLVWKARAVLPSLRNMSTVAVSSAATARSLKDCGQLDSAVTAKRVPQLTPG